MDPAENTAIALPSSLTIENVEAVASEIRQSGFDSKQPLILDAAQLKTITTAGIQLFLSLHKTLSQAGGKLVLLNCGDAVSHTAQILGLQSYVEGWSESHA